MAVLLRLRFRHPHLACKSLSLAMTISVSTLSLRSSIPSFAYPAQKTYRRTEIQPSTKLSTESCRVNDAKANWSQNGVHNHCKVLNFLGREGGPVALNKIDECRQHRGGKEHHDNTRVNNEMEQRPLGRFGTQLLCDRSQNYHFFDHLTHALPAFECERFSHDTNRQAALRVTIAAPSETRGHVVERGTVHRTVYRTG